jgi:hypothetical protein
VPSMTATGCPVTGSSALTTAWTDGTQAAALPGSPVAFRHSSVMTVFSDSQKMALAHSSLSRWGR